MPKHFRTGALAVLSLLSARAALGWNATGHEVVAFVAWSQLTPDTRAKVTALLKDHPDYKRTFIREGPSSAPARDEQAFAIAATWPDLIRSESFGKSNMYARSNWHYVDFPYVLGNFPMPPAPSLEWSPGKEPENAAQAILKNVADLRNTKLSNVDRAVALCWVEHLIGDIHQPLHATSMFSNNFPTGDRGGNSQFIKMPGDGGGGRSLNLHSLWDGMVGGYMSIDKTRDIAQGLIAAHPRKEFTAELADQNVKDWIKQSYEQAIKVVYLNGKLKTSASRESAAPELPAGYLEAAKPIAGRDTVLGGMRLADTLNAVFADIPMPTTAPATAPATQTAP
jgi:hypothetical protein